MATVCLNAAALAVVAGKVPNLATGIGAARAAIDDGAALRLVAAMRERAAARSGAGAHG